MTPQSSIAHYRVVSKLGEGGMGEVWRARDTKLGRDVAIKVLPSGFAQDPDRMARFQREAQVLASLNHPNIAAIHGVEEAALVMELVEGTTLAERIAQGPMDLGEARPLIDQLVDALEYAHEKGIVHRDLKPANIKVTPEGRVKVLDFGLAKALSGDTAASDPSTSPTLTIRATMSGVIMGTAAYMSPEQARGQNVDKRADIWAFGVIVYEMLTGRQLFEAQTVSDTLAAVLKETPDFQAVPLPMRTLVGHCLIKDARQRMRDVGDARILLNETQPVVAVRTKRPYVLWSLLAAAALAVLILGAQLWKTIKTARPQPLWLSVDLGPDAIQTRDFTVAISPDGSRIVFPVRTTEGNQLAVRLLAEPKATPLAGTEGGINPFFAPNGEWVAFGAAGKIKKVSIHGGAPLILCDGALRGGTWTEDGYIIASLGNSTGLSRIPDGGGQPEALTTPAKGELTLRWPQILPGGRAVLFSASANQSNWENATIDVLSLKTGQRKTVQKGGFFGRYLPSGHLVYVRGGALYGAPFDTDRLELTGPPATLLEDLAASSFGGGQFDFSRNGTFVYTSGTPKSYGWGIVSVDSRGTVQPVVSTRGIYFRLALSPEGNRLALAAGSPGAADLWVYELDREISTRLTFSSDAVGGVWSPDGRYLVHSTTPGENSAIVAVRADGVGQRRRLLPAADKQTPLIPQAFSPDGRYLIFLRFASGLSDMWSVEISNTASGEWQAGKPEPLLESPAAEAGAAISPDGRWIAYNSNESGRYEVFVRPFGSGRITSGGKWQVSANGGAHPVWSKAGKQVLFLTPGDHIMVADYAVDGESFRVSRPRPWVDKPIPTYTFLSGLPFGQGLAAFDLSRDGRKIITFEAPEAAYAPKGNLHVTMLVNWFDTVRRRVGGARN